MVTVDKKDFKEVIEEINRRQNEENQFFNIRIEPNDKSSEKS